MVVESQNAITIFQLKIALTRDEACSSARGQRLCVPFVGAGHIYGKKIQNGLLRSAVNQHQACRTVSTKAGVIGSQIRSETTPLLEMTYGAKGLCFAMVKQCGHCGNVSLVESIY